MENGVSKTVLYKHFTDKKGLTDAAMERYIETVLVPRIHEALSEDLDEYQLTRAVIAAYVTTVATDPEIYIYVHANNSAANNREIITASEQLIADVLSAVTADRLRTREFSTAGAMPIAFAMIGAVRLASHWWIYDRTMSADELVDYLTMMVGRYRGYRTRPGLGRTIRGGTSPVGRGERGSVACDLARDFRSPTAGRPESRRQADRARTQSIARDDCLVIGRPRQR